GMREAKPRQAGGRVRLVAEGVPGLLGRGAVVAEAVRFDDEVELRPVEVDLEAVEMDPGQWFREARGAGDGQKPALELRIGQDECVAVEEAAKGGEPGAPCYRLESLAQALGRDQIQLVGFVDGGFQLPLGERRGEVDECDRRRGCR